MIRSHHFIRLVAVLLIPAMTMGSIGPVGAGPCPLPQWNWIDSAGRHGGLPLQFNEPFDSQALAVRSGTTSGLVSRTATAFVFGLALTALTAVGQTADPLASPNTNEGNIVSVQELAKPSDYILQQFEKKIADYKIAKAAKELHRPAMLGLIGIKNTSSLTEPELEVIRLKYAKEVQNILVVMLHSYPNESEGYHKLNDLVTPKSLDLSDFGIQEAKKNKKASKPPKSNTPAKPPKSDTPLTWLLFINSSLSVIMAGSIRKKKSANGPKKMPKQEKPLVLSPSGAFEVLLNVVMNILKENPSAASAHSTDLLPLPTTSEITNGLAFADQIFEAVIEGLAEFNPELSQKIAIDAASFALQLYNREIKRLEATGATGVAQTAA